MPEQSSSNYFGILNALSQVSSSSTARDWLQTTKSPDVEWPNQPVLVQPSLPPILIGPSPSVPIPDTPAPAGPSRSGATPEPGIRIGQQAPSLDLPAALVAGELSSGIAELQEVRKDVRSRAKWAFFGALSFAGLGGLTVVGGVALALGGLISPGVITALAGSAINGTFGGLLWRLHRSSAQELLDLSSDIRRFRDASFAVWIAGQVDDRKQRDEVMIKLAETIRAGSPN